MNFMAYTKQLSPSEILQVAIGLVERNGAARISLRGLAAELGVKAPSLYRYFPTKNALEKAVAEEVLRLMFTELGLGTDQQEPESRFIEMAYAYLYFARTRYALYSFLMQDRLHAVYDSHAGKEVWKLLLELVSQISKRFDDTSAAVASWAFLHGYATLEHAGGFGKSAPRDGLDLGLRALIDGFAKQGADNRTISRRKQQKA